MVESLVRVAGILFEEISSYLVRGGGAAVVVKFFLCSTLIFSPSLVWGSYILANAQGSNDRVFGGAVTVGAGILIATFTVLIKHVTNAEIHATPGKLDEVSEKFDRKLDKMISSDMCKIVSGNTDNRINAIDKQIGQIGVSIDYIKQYGSAGTRQIMDFLKKNSKP